MLRRPPTTLTLTSEDIAIYEDKRGREAAAQRQRTNNSNAAHLYDPEEMLSHNNLNPYSHMPPTHSKRRTILDPPAPAQASSAGAASEQDLRNFAAQQQRHRQTQNHQQHRGAGASHGVHFTPVPRGGSVSAHSNGAAGLGATQPGDDSDLLPAEGLSSPPEAPALLLQSSSEEDQDDHNDEDGNDDESPEDDDDDEDEEMADYDAPGHMQALPRSARPISYAQHQPSRRAASVNLTTPVNMGGGAQGGQAQQQHTPIPNNHSTAAVSQIPQAPQRRGHSRTASATVRSVAGAGRGEAGEVANTTEAQFGAQRQPPAPTRMTRSREERIGAPAPGSRRTGR